MDGPQIIPIVDENTGTNLYNNVDAKGCTNRLRTQQISFSPSKYPRVSIVASTGYPKKYKKWSIKLRQSGTKRK